MVKTSTEADGLLNKFRPRLIYDSQGRYRAVSASTMTDNPGNELVRNDGTVIARSLGRRSAAVASAEERATDGLSPLSLDLLGGEAGIAARADDRLCAAPDRIGDALRLQADERYADRAHCRVVEDRGGRAWLQYWLWFYCRADFADFGGGEGDWKLLQLRLNQDRSRPDLVVLQQRRSFGQTRWAGLDLSGSATGEQNPRVYVSPFSHGLYPSPIQERHGALYDGTDGKGPQVLPKLEAMGSWAAWPGHWGRSGPGPVRFLRRESPRSPGRQPAWSDPAVAEGQGLTIEGGFATALDSLTRIASQVVDSGSATGTPAPTIDARLEVSRVVVSYRSRQGRGWAFASVHVGSALTASRIQEVGQTGDIALDLAEDAESCVVRVSSLDRTWRRSDVVMQEVGVDDADDAEHALLVATLEQEVTSDEFARYAHDPGLSGDDLTQGVLDEQRGIWEAVPIERRAHRDAKAEVEELETLEALSRARPRINGWPIAATALGVLGGIGYLLSWSLPAPLALLAAAFALLVAWVRPSRRARARARRRLPSEWDRSDLRRAEFERRADLEVALREKAIRPALRALVNERRTLPYGNRLSFSGKGLTEQRNPRHEIPTSASMHLERVAEATAGGSIGIAGPRGVGKSTLMNAFCDSRRKTGWLTVLLPAPVEYDARDFVLTLFGATCREVQRSRRVVARPGAGADATRQSETPAKQRAGILAGVTASVGAAGAVATVVALSDSVSGSWVSLATVLLVVLGAAVSMVQALLARRQLDPEDTPEARLQAEADARLRSIRFQQSYSYGYSGKLAPPIGVELSADKNTTLSDKQLSFPEIVGQLRAFLEHAASVRLGVVIGIDELDKMESAEAAQRFLNEVKAIFGVPGCIYLVSVSENAMSQFERRGLPFRDVFDSSFAEILSIPPLALEESTNLMRRRTTALSAPFVDLCHVLSGGLPRDLLRTARRLVYIQAQAESAEAQRTERPKVSEADVMAEDERDLRSVCRQLVAEELRRKVEAVAVSARSSSLEPGTRDLIAWIRRLSAEELTPDALIEHSRALPALRGPILDDERADARRLELLRTELAAFMYYMATVLEVFAALGSRDVETAERNGTFEALATTRQKFADHAEIAWKALDAFRQGQSPPLRTVPFPDGCGAGTATARTNAQPGQSRYKVRDGVVRRAQWRLYLRRRRE